MAWSPHPKVADCRDIARKWKKQQVIIIAVDVHANTIEYASYGDTRERCSRTEQLADIGYRAIHNRLLDEAEIPLRHPLRIQ